MSLLDLCRLPLRNGLLDARRRATRASRSRLARIVLAAAVGAGTLAGPAVATPAAAASCTRDPYNGACVRPVTYQLRTHRYRLAVQRSPRSGGTLRRIRFRGAVNVICQINNGRSLPGYRSHTWNAIAGGGWVYAPYIRMPVARNGFTPGLRHCGARPASPPPARTPAARPAPTATPTSAPVPGSSSLDPAGYPWPAENGWAGDAHGYWQGECVSFAAWAIRVDGLPHAASADWLGNADRWTATYVDSAPHVGDIAQWYAGHAGAGSAGHVAYVAAVNGDGTVRVWEYNWGTFHRFNTRTIPASTPSRYLHF